MNDSLPTGERTVLRAGEKLQDYGREGGKKQRVHRGERGHQSVYTIAPARRRRKKHEDQSGHDFGGSRGLSRLAFLCPINFSGG